MLVQLKGGDSIIYHALKLYKLQPELRWTAGGYIWPVDQTVEMVSENADSPTASIGRQSLSGLGGGSVAGSASGGRGMSSRGPFSSTASEPGEDETDDLRLKVVKSGGIPLVEADIMVLSDHITFPGVISREKVPFVSSLGEMEKLVVNVLMVVYVP